MGYCVKSNEKGFKRIISAFFFSMAGLKVCFKYEVSFRQIVFVSFFFFVIACFLGRDFFEVIILSIPLFFMIFAELVNTAIEKIIDLVQPTFHPLARDAKDIGSSLQLISMVFSAFVWGGYIIMRLFV